MIEINSTGGMIGGFDVIESPYLATMIYDEAGKKIWCKDVYTFIFAIESFEKATEKDVLINLLKRYESNRIKNRELGSNC